MILCISCVSTGSIDTYASGGVYIGQAVCNEKGGSYGGKAGDQTGKELAISAWTYSKKKKDAYHWVYVFRAKDPSVANKLASNMKKACQNSHIGYDLRDKDRETLYYAAQKVNWNISSVKVDCETTCVDVVSVCLNSVGIKTPSAWASVYVYRDLMKTGMFVCYTTADYTSSSSKLKAGDILCNPNAPHTAMVVESPLKTSASTKSSSGNTNNASKISQFKTGKQYQLTTELNVRKGPSKKYAVKTNKEISKQAREYSVGETRAVLNKGTVVKCTGVNGNWIKTTHGWLCGTEGGKRYLEEYKATTGQKILLNNAKKKVVNKKSTGTKLKIQKNKEYKLKAAMNVRSGPGTNYRILKRGELTASGKKNSVKANNAVLKKGTIVTCLEVKGDWMRIPSGWVCCKPEYVANK